MLQKLAAMQDDKIDYSDIPETTAEDWRGAKRMADFRPVKKPVSIRLDADVLTYFKGKASDGGYQSLINAALREYVEHHMLKGVAKTVLKRKEYSVYVSFSTTEGEKIIRLTKGEKVGIAHLFGKLTKRNLGPSDLDLVAPEEQGAVGEAVIKLRDALEDTDQATA